MKTYFLQLFGVLGLTLLEAACAPAARPPTQVTPLSTISSTQITGPTETASAAMQITPSTRAVVDATSVPTTIPNSPTFPAVQSCHEPQGRLAVADLDSATLARRVAYSIYLPPCYDTDPARVYPVLYLLHGINADQTQWPDLNLALDADALIAQHAIAPLVVVMPDGDYRQGEDYATFVLRDLMPHIEQTTRVSHQRTDRAIGGLSRGGYWALYLALMHPDLFAAVGGHSPVTNAALTELLALPGEATARNMLRIYLDVGRNDPLASSVTPFAAALEAHGFKSVFHLYAGGHDRAYWRTHTSEYLLFYAADWQR